MTDPFGEIKQIFLKRLSRIAFLAGILLLLLPCYSWLLVRSYQITIQIPREREQFEEEERQIVQALRRFKIKNHQYPERLTTLVPDYLDVSIEKSEKWSFHYGLYEDGEFFLSANIPQSWFGWPARRVCRSQPNESLDCNFYFVCRYKQGIEVLTDPIDQNQSFRQVLGKHQTNPCTNQY